MSKVPKVPEQGSHAKHSQARFPNKKVSKVAKVPTRQGSQTRRCPWFPKLPNKLNKIKVPKPCQIPRFGFQSRFPNKKLSKVSKQGSQALGRFPGLGSQTSPQTRGFPSKVSQGSQARLLRSSTLAVEVCRGRENVKCTLFT